MIPEMAKLKIEELAREELMVLIHELAKKISELEAEIAGLKQPPIGALKPMRPWRLF
jgi:hypothetical protein